MSQPQSGDVVWPPRRPRLRVAKSGNTWVSVSGSSPSPRPRSSLALVGSCERSDENLYPGVEGFVLVAEAFVLV